MDDLGTILAVFAHPDDETYLCAGIMAAAVARGDRVACITATRGELGSTDEEKYPPGPPLAEIRTEELARALAYLGVTEHHWLDYPDGGCDQVDGDEAVGRVSAIAAEVRPDTILTFGPDGQTGHPDHIAVGEWATKVAADCGARVHYATNTPEWMERFRAPLDELGVFMGAEPPTHREDQLSIHLELTGDLLEAKIQAILAQESQVRPLVDALGEDFMYAALPQEAFWSPS